MVIPRALASSLSNVNVCSPKATMTLYDIFFTPPDYRNFTKVSNASAVCTAYNPYKNAGFDANIPMPVSLLPEVNCWLLTV